MHHPFFFSMPEHKTTIDIEEKKVDQPLVRKHSFDTDATTLYSEVSEVRPFTRGKTLTINAKGHALVRLPIPPKQMEITITDSNQNLLYTSTRAKRSSGDAVLSDSSGKSLIATNYFFGPGRDPEMHLLQRNEGQAEKDVLDDNEKDGDDEGIKTKSAWTSRTHIFTMPDGKEFEWRYISERRFTYGKERVLALYEKLGKKTGRTIAQFVRNDETRTPGTSKSTAGNGGELVLDSEYGSVLDEPVVVATCLLMLKKEIDRRRGLQIAVLAGGAGGGS